MGLMDLSYGPFGHPSLAPGDHRKDSYLARLLPPVIDHHSQLEGLHGRLGAIRDPQLRDDAAHVLLYGARADQEISGDLLVGESSHQQHQDLDLPRRKRRG